MKFSFSNHVESMDSFSLYVENAIHGRPPGVGVCCSKYVESIICVNTVQISFFKIATNLVLQRTII
jgi:hypothetical protein